MAAVYIIFAVAAGLVAGVVTYDFAGLLWAFVAYCVSGCLAVFALALGRFLCPANDEPGRSRVVPDNRRADIVR